MNGRLLPAIARPDLLPGATVGLSAVLGVLLVVSPPLALPVFALLAGAALAWLAMRAAAFDLAAALMFLTLPLQSAFVIDVGVTLRLSFLFGLCAVGIGTITGRLRWPDRQPVWYALTGFLLVVTASILLTPLAPTPSFAEQSGLRGMPLVRPMLQCLQLASMAAFMLVTVNYAGTWTAFRRALSCVLIGGLLALGYGLYGFGVLLAGSEAGPEAYIEINNAMNTDFGRGYREHGISGMAGYIPRPRSTFPEPLNFANYLLLILPLVLVRVVWSAGWRRALWLAVALAGFFLFVVSINSRGALFGCVVALAALTAFARGPRHLMRVALPAGAALGAALALFVMVAPAIHPVLTPTRIAEYVQFRVVSATASGNRVLSDWAHTSPIFFDHPVFGVGFGNTPFYLSRVDDYAYSGVVDAGSLYTRLLVEVGVVGSLMYLLFLGLLLWALLRAGRDVRVASDRRLLAVVLFGVLVADSVQRVSLVGIATDVHLWVIFGLAVALVRLADADRAAAAAQEANR